MKLHAEMIDESWVLPSGEEICVDDEAVIITSYHFLNENDWYYPPQHRCHKCRAIFPADTLALHTKTHAYVPCVPCDTFTEFKRSW